MKTKNLLLLLIAASFCAPALAQPAAAAKAVPKPVPTLADCVKQNAATRADLKAAFAKARADNRINLIENMSFTSSETKVTSMEKQLSAGGLTLAECEQIKAELAKEKASLDKMIASANATPKKPPAPAPDPKLIECVKANRATDSEIDAMFKAAVVAKKITPDEKAAYDKAEARIEAHRRKLASDGLTLTECKQLTLDLVAEKKAVQSMAATPVPKK